VFFDNPSTSENRMRDVTVSIMRQADGKETDVSISKRKITTRLEAGPKIDLTNIPVAPSRRSEPYWIECVFWLEPAVATKLDENCFFRLTMAALRQPDQSIDLKTDWVNAINSDDPVPLRPLDK
jgi:hypothetical protein